MSYATAPLSRAVRALADCTRDLAPIVGVVAFFQLVVLGQPIPAFREVIAGTPLVLVGLALFVEGLTIGLFPIGETLAYSFAQRRSLFWLLTFAIALGVIRIIKGWPAQRMISEWRRRAQP